MESESRMRMSEYILTIHGDSSSIKFALYQIGELLEQRVVGKVDRIAAQTHSPRRHPRAWPGGAR